MPTNRETASLLAPPFLTLAGTLTIRGAGRAGVAWEALALTLGAAEALVTLHSARSPERQRAGKEKTPLNSNELIRNASRHSGGQID